MASETGFRIRPLTAADQDPLWDIFHVALWDPPPAPLRPREILQHPDVRIYAEDFGHREGDLGVALEAPGDTKAVGACWMRLVRGGRGLAYIDEETPQLGIVVMPPWQGLGHGKRLMRAALDAARARYRKVSLSVHPENPAQHLYRQCGFAQVDVRRTYLVMVADLAKG